jgi:hypothetical protein
MARNVYILGRKKYLVLGRLMVAELFRRVGQHRVIDETVISERETFNPFHGKEQPGKVFRKSPLCGMPMSLCFQHRYRLRHPFRDSEWESLETSRCLVESRVQVV